LTVIQDIQLQEIEDTIRLAQSGERPILRTFYGVGRNYPRVGRNVGRSPALRGIFAAFLRRMRAEFTAGNC
jgi:hypothetical protein